MVVVFVPEMWVGFLDWTTIVLGSGSGRYASGSGVGCWPSRIVPCQVPLPLVPGIPVTSNSEQVQTPLPVDVAASGALESTMVGTPITVTAPPPVLVRAPGAVGSRTMMPIRNGTQRPWATAR